MLSKLFNKLTNKIMSPTKKETIVEKKKTKVAPTRIGEIGEYKIDIQLDQLPKNYKYLSDLLIVNKDAKSGYSQIDHVIFTPYAILVIETKNYSGTIYGDRSKAKWSVNGKFPLMNPFNQNYGHIQAIKSLLQINDTKHFVSIISFNKRCTFKVNEELRKIQSDELIVYDIELTEFISRKLNVIKIQNPVEVFSSDEIMRMYDHLHSNNITDKDIRNMHIQAFNVKQ